MKSQHRRETGDAVPADKYVHPDGPCLERPEFPPGRRAHCRTNNAMDVLKHDQHDYTSCFRTWANPWPCLKLHGSIRVLRMCNSQHRPVARFMSSVRGEWTHKDLEKPRGDHRDEEIPTPPKDGRRPVLDSRSTPSRARSKRDKLTPLKGPLLSIRPSRRSVAPVLTLL